MQLSIYQKDNRKRHGPSWRVRLVWASGLLFLLALVAWYSGAGARLRVVANQARVFIFENSYFAVREIQVRGGEKVGGDAIVAMAGLRHGMNMWRIEAAVIEKKVGKHPWVRRVWVRREFPRRVVIEVEERTPKAIVAMGKLYYVDVDGMVFKEVSEGENVRFPLLTGLSAQEIANPNSLIRRRIQDAIRLGELMAKDSHTLSEIHFSAPDRLVLYTTSYPVALHMGWGDWDGKLQRLNRVLALWKGNEERLTSLDVSFRDQVVARVRRAGP